LDPSQTAFQSIYSNFAYVTPQEWSNGVLSVSVVNELTTPNSTVNNDVEVNVFISAGDDFEVFAPTSANISKFTFFQPQSGEEVPDRDATLEPSKPMHEESMVLGEGEQDISDINKGFMGESIGSFRPLLRRPQFFETIALPNGRNRTLCIRSNQPYLRGYAPDAVRLTSGSVAYNYVNTVLYHWIRYCFQGHRGSMRYKFVPRLVHSGGYSSYSAYATRMGANDANVVTQWAETKQTVQTTDTDSRAAFQSVYGTGSEDLAETPALPLEGSAYTEDSANTTLEFEIPYYRNYRFSPGKAANFTGQTATPLVAQEPRFRFLATSQVTAGSVVDSWVSIGEDFQFVMWTGLPRMYSELTAPLPI
jgi:hypothetical protein